MDKRTLADQTPEPSEIEWLCIDVTGYKTINVYKPPPSHQWTSQHPHTPVCMLASSTASNWGYSTTSPDDESLTSWAAANNLELLHKPKG